MALLQKHRKSCWFVMKSGHLALLQGWPGCCNTPPCWPQYPSVVISHSCMDGMPFTLWKNCWVFSDEDNHHHHAEKKPETSSGERLLFVPTRTYSCTDRTRLCPALYLPYCTRPFLLISVVLNPPYCYCTRRATVVPEPAVVLHLSELLMYCCTWQL